MSRSLGVVAGLAVLAAGGAWLAALRDRGPAPIAHVHRALPHVAAAPHLAAAAAPNSVVISGVVYDDRQAPVAGVDVIVRAGGREARATTDAEGAWIAAVLPGVYRVYVRGSGLLAAGEAERPRLDGDPFARQPDVPDEGLMPKLVVTGDTPNLELAVVRAATLAGSVVDTDGQPIAGALVHARPTDAGALVPVVGTDTARTDALGNYAVEVPGGTFVVDLAHPGYATAIGDVPRTLEPGARFVDDYEHVLARGCAIAGRVVDGDGRPANDGALELGDLDDGGFRPGGRIGGDGTFRFTTLEPGAITLRAWPWRSAPSTPRHFACDDGARFAGVTFVVPRDVQPDLAGTVVDAAGEPVPLAYLDIEPLDTPAPHQQERASSDGTYRVFDAPRGRYHLTAAVAGRGVASAVALSPGTQRLALGGTGRIAGTVTGVANGSLETAFETCADPSDPDQPIRVAHEPQIVPVIGGRFAIDGAPACTLTLTARWRGIAKQLEVAVTANATAAVELDVGTPAEKLVRGVVRDGSRAPVANVRVIARLGDRLLDTVTADDDGRFTIHAAGGAELSASSGGMLARALVGRANVADEELELVLSSR